MRGDGFSCFPCSPLRVPYLWASLGSSLVFNILHLLIKKKKKNTSFIILLWLEIKLNLVDGPSTLVSFIDWVGCR